MNVLRVFNTSLLAGIFCVQILLLLRVREPIVIKEPIAIKGAVAVEGWNPFPRVRAIPRAEPIRVVIDE